MQFPLLLIGLFFSSFVTGVQPIAAQTDTMFPDVPKDHWAYESVKALKEMGILQGYPPKR